MNHEHERVAKEMAKELTHEDQNTTLDELEQSHFAHQDMHGYILDSTDATEEETNDIINRAFEIARNNHE